MHRAISGFGRSRTKQAGAVLAALASAAALTLGGTAAHAAPGRAQQPGQSQAHHHFSTAAARMGAASTMQERVALATQALNSSASGLQKAYDVAPLFTQHIDGTGITIATLVSYGDKSAQ